MDWPKAIDDFWVDSSHETWLKREATGNCSYKARVQISSENFDVNEITTVRIIRNGYEDGAVLIDETGKLTAENVHTKYLPIPPTQCNYQKITRTLLISGKSQKLGAYEVKIRAMEA